jgi:hypothetical protein
VIETVPVEVQYYPWLPPKCSLCGGFGHLAYACAKKEKKIWLPKQVGYQAVKNIQMAAKQSTPKHFDQTIRKPSSGSKPKRKEGGLRLSNSFDAIGMEIDAEGEVHDKTPSTFLDFFEKAISSRDKGKAKIGEHEEDVDLEKGFSPTKYEDTYLEYKGF